MSFLELDGILAALGEWYKDRDYICHAFSLVFQTLIQLQTFKRAQAAASPAGTNKKHSQG